MLPSQNILNEKSEHYTGFSTKVYRLFIISNKQDKGNHKRITLTLKYFAKKCTSYKLNYSIQNLC